MYFAYYTHNTVVNWEWGIYKQARHVFGLKQRDFFICYLRKYFNCIVLLFLVGKNLM